MRRRLLILAASFGLLLLILATFQLFNLQSEHEQPVDSVGLTGDISEDDRIVFKAHIRDEAEGDQAGQLRMIIVAPECHRRNDGIYVMYNPCVEVRDIGGGRLYATADVAEMNLQPAGESYKLISAKFFSRDGRRSVKVYFDRAPTEDSPTFKGIANSADEIQPIFDALDGRRADMIRLYAEDLTYREDTMEATSDGTLIIYAAEADMAGEGLLVRWNEQPQELRRLQITEGKSIRLYNLADSENFIAMPGEETPEDAEDVTEADLVASTDTPDEGEAALPTAPVATGPEASDEEDDIRPMRNQYYARFHDGVSVRAGSRRLWGADTLTLEFELDDAARDSLQNEADQETGDQASSLEADGFDFVAGHWADSPDLLLLGDTPDGQETEADADMISQIMDDDEFGTAEKPVVISWLGALELEPTGYTPDPNPENYVVSAVGNDVHLEDNQATVLCHSVEFRNPDRQGELTGTADHPVRLYLAGGQELLCREIAFDMPAGKVNLQGPGAIRQGAGGATLAISEGGDLAQSMSGAGSINWQGEAVATIINDEESGRQYLRYAIFKDDVVLTQSGPEMVALDADLADEEMPPYDFLRCDQMEVWMDDSGSGEQIMPTVAEAEGNVIAHQAGSVIRAAMVNVFFEEVETLDDEDQPQMELAPTTIVAKDDVRISDVSGAEQPISASAREIRTDLREKIAVLIGTAEEPAEIYQGRNVLRGEKIKLNQNTFSAAVEGHGEMRFVTDTDLNGNTLDEEVPMDIEWDGRMEYQGQKNDVSFAGGVHLVSGNDSVQCGHLRLLFEKDESDEDADTVADSGEAGDVDVADGDASAPDADAEDEQVAEAPEDDEDEEFSLTSSRGLGMGIERYGKRKLTMIIASDDVQILSRRENEQGQLIGRMKLTARQRLMYDAPMKELSIFGEGTLLVEDYEIDMESGQPRMRTDSTGNATLQGPSQTAMIWDDEMRIEQETRTARISGEVRMIHRSGNEIQETEGLNVPEWGQLESGRLAKMNCDGLVAVFAPPEEEDVADVEPDPEATGPDDMWESGPALGPLETFVATGRVNMQDGYIQIQGEQLDYSRAADKAIILGCLPNEPLANASLIYDNPETGAFQSYSRPKLEIFLDDGQIKDVIVHREP